MRTIHYTLLAGIALAIVGFVTAALLDEKSLGMNIFLAGFFVGATSGVLEVVTRAVDDLGKVGLALKIVSGGFGVIVVGELIGILFDRDGLVIDILFFAGIGIMLFGILVAFLRMVKH